MRPTLEDHGINLTGKWIGTFYGMAAGGLDKRGAFDQSLHFDLKVDSPNSQAGARWRVSRVWPACATAMD
jgi:hypothetical protein